MIYFDNSSTTKPSSAAIDATLSAMRDDWGNPSSLHRLGINAEIKISDTRAAVAKALGCEEKEVYFTSGGTEANNLAVIGAATARRRRGNRVVTTAIEHPSVLECFDYLESEGFEVIRLAPDSSGNISSEAIEQAVNDKTVLVSMMMVNNETGVILPIEAARKALDRYDGVGVLHVDAVQAFGKLPINVKKLGIDLMSVSGHKIHGPKGVGALYKSSSLHILPRALGGGQEKAIRSGTEGVPAILGFGAAIKEIDLNKNYETVKAVNLYARNKLTELGAVINSAEDSLPYILNFSLVGYKSETLLHFLESREIYVSSGSACAKGKGSHVLTAMGLKREIIDSAIRLSFSKENTAEEVDEFIIALGTAKKILRHR